MTDMATDIMTDMVTGMVISMAALKRRRKRRQGEDRQTRHGGERPMQRRLEGDKLRHGKDNQIETGRRQTETRKRHTISDTYETDGGR